MRTERWYWLYLFCAISFGIHGAVFLESRLFHGTDNQPSEHTVEVTLSPRAPALPKTTLKAVSVSLVKPLPKITPAPAIEPKHVIKTVVPAVEKLPVMKPATGAVKVVKNTPAPSAESPVEKLQNEAPSPIEKASLINPNTPRTRINRSVSENSDSPNVSRLHNRTDSSIDQPENTNLSSNNKEAVNDAPTRPNGGKSILSDAGGNLLANVTPEDRPGNSIATITAPKVGGTIGALRRVPGANVGITSSNAGNAPGARPGRSIRVETPGDSRPGTEYAGGSNVDGSVAATGKRGGRSILSGADSNLLGNGIPDDKPGFAIKPGGLASGSLGGLHRKLGINGGIASMSKGGPSSGTSSGRKINVEQPGTTGAGNGYQPGKSVGDGDDSELRVGRARGTPFGDLAGILGGTGKNNEPGDIKRGGVFGSATTGNSSGARNVVYALDISGSMNDGNKIKKAQEELKRALSELRKGDTFNIVCFKKTVEPYSNDLVPVTANNIANAREYIDNIKIGDGTNLSQAVDLALSMNGITQVFIMSDGEPNGGIEDFSLLRKFVIEKNIRKVPISTFAIGLGEKFKGMKLLRSIAEDNKGTFDYVDMTKVKLH